MHKTFPHEDFLLLLQLQEYQVADDYNKMNHVRDYLGK